jgi:hypothetical protein
LASYLYPDGKTVNQALWRGDKAFNRTIPINNDGNPDFNNASAWSAPIDILGLPGTGDFKAFDTEVYAHGKALIQGFWRGTDCVSPSGTGECAGFTRMIPFNINPNDTVALIGYGRSQSLEDPIDLIRFTVKDGAGNVVFGPTEVAASAVPGQSGLYSARTSYTVTGALGSRTVEIKVHSPTQGWRP